MTHDAKFQAVIEYIRKKIDETEESEELYDRLIWFYREVYQVWFIYQSELLQYRN